MRWCEVVMNWWRRFWAWLVGRKQPVAASGVGRAVAVGYGASDGTPRARAASSVVAVARAVAQRTSMTHGASFMAAFACGAAARVVRPPVVPARAVAFAGVPVVYAGRVVTYAGT